MSQAEWIRFRLFLARIGNGRDEPGAVGIFQDVVESIHDGRCPFRCLKRKATAQQGLGEAACPTFCTQRK